MINNYISKVTVKEAMEKTGYYPDEHMLNAIWVSIMSGRPLIVEGEPGVGKTSSSAALAKGLNLNYQRLQMYEGLTADKILYDFNYTKVLLASNMIHDKAIDKYCDVSINDAIQGIANETDFFNDAFIIKRPILDAITNPKRTVLCIDELDKSSEEVEYMLYEFLEDYAITIPENGKTYTCDPDKPPIVFITSNGYRELSDALRRRCNYIYIKEKSTKDLAKILNAKTNVSETLAAAVAECFTRIRKMPQALHHMPSVSEAINFANYLSFTPNLTKKYVSDGLNLICKNHRDENVIQQQLNELAKQIS